jgi:hypothetical protein
MPSRIVIGKAVDNDVPVESIIIDVSASVPDGMHRPEYEAYYDAQAEAIANALYDTLPGGTFERVIAKLLVLNASIYVGKYGKAVTVSE